MFRFNFTPDEPDEVVSNQVEINPEDDTNKTTCLESRQLTIRIDPLVASQVASPSKTSTFRISDGGPELCYLSSEAVSSASSKSEALRTAENNHSDLLPGIYEGGFKIWECTQDLCEYIERHVEPSLLRNSSVLDLGCGAGLVGILCGIHGAKSLHFQDYNEEVLLNWTSVNATLNGVSAACHFYSGDWGSFASTFPGKVDYIFTSETIYNVVNYRKLLRVFQSCLAQKGKVYVAAKSYYFGVGGGTGQFKDLLNRKGFTWRTCWECKDAGVSREIFVIQRSDDVEDD